MIKEQIFHSDQGSEYQSNHVIDILKLNKIKVSMSNKSSPWQNGKQESFYQKFKFELDDLNISKPKGTHRSNCAANLHYNHKRIHSTLKMTPTVFYQRFKTAESSENSAAVLHINLQGDMQNKKLII